jgi:glucan phosphoethanolaminetransferase (alkaline phosphatase superfamily)
MGAGFYEAVPHPALWADALLVVHALIVCFVVGGQAAILLGWWRGWAWVRNPWFRIAHLATIAVVVLQAWLGRLCPLTIWERELRRAAGQAFHERSFVEYWVSRFLYWDLPWWVFVAVYTAFGVLVAWSWWRLPPLRASTSRGD